MNTLLITILTFYVLSNVFLCGVKYAENGNRAEFWIIVVCILFGLPLWTIVNYRKWWPYIYSLQFWYLLWFTDQFKNFSEKEQEALSDIVKVNGAKSPVGKILRYQYAILNRKFGYNIQLN